jgi:hypothetical protein
MTLSQAKRIAADPVAHSTKLRLALLKLEVAVLRAFPSSPKQRELQSMAAQIRLLPRELWHYPA